MKVLMLPSFYPPLGGEFCTEQAKALSQSGVEVHILANNHISITSQKKGFITMPWRYEVRKDQGMQLMINFQRRLPKLYRYNIRQWIKRTVYLYSQYVARFGSPDIIHVHCCKWAGCAALEIKKRYGIPYVITEHLSYDLIRWEQQRQQPFIRSILRDAYAGCDRLICVSEELYADGAEWIAKEQPVSIVSNIVSADFFRSEWPETEPKTKFTFLCLNNFWRPKGYDILLKAVDILAETSPDFCVQIAGGGFNCKEFEKMFSSCRNKDKIQLLGRRNRAQVIYLLSQADALALPSRAEAQPRTILESLAMGVPVVCTDIIPRQLVTVHTGIRVENENPEAFARGMAEMMANRTEFSGRRISDYVAQFATEDIVSRSLIEIYKNILTKNK